MTTKHLLANTLLLAAMTAWSLGCGSSGPPPSKAGHDHAHDHDHDHAHHGPHGGHIVEIGKEEYHAEWTHDEDGRINVYILDAEMKKEVPIASEEIVIEVKIGDNRAPYTLTAVNRTEGDNPTSSQFEIVSKDLLGGLESLKKGAVEATLKLNINGKDYDAKMTEEEHSHGHKH